MPGETAQKGIGAAFHIESNTRAMRDMFSSLRNAGVQSIDPNDAHLTIIDRAETTIPIFSERDQISLNRARYFASVYLSTLPHRELVLRPEEPKLTVFGRRIGIAIANDDFVLGVRDYVANIFHEEAGISVSNRSYIPHISVGRKTRGVENAAKRVKQARVPRQFHVIGHDVSERIFFEQADRMRSQKRTIKRPSPGADSARHMH